MCAVVWMSRGKSELGVFERDRGRGEMGRGRWQRCTQSSAGRGNPRHFLRRTSAHRAALYVGYWVR